MKVYVVYLTYYKGCKLPPWYIGSTYKSKIDKGYNGTISSKEFKDIYIKEQKENKALFKTRILSFHKTREKAYIEELRLQVKHKVVNNYKYFNKSYANKSFGLNQENENNSMFGRNHTEKSKKIISEKNKINSKEREIKRQKTIKKRSLENSLKIYKKISETKNNKSDIEKKKIIEKFKKNVGVIEENGNKKSKNMALKSAKSKLKILENGLTIQENGARKAAETRKKGNYFGLNHVRCKKVYIYNQYNQIVYISNKSFKKFCLEKKIPFGVFNKSKINNGLKVKRVKNQKNNIYIGWYAKFNEFKFFKKRF